MSPIPKTKNVGLPGSSAQVPRQRSCTWTPVTVYLAQHVHVCTLHQHCQHYITLRYQGQNKHHSIPTWLTVHPRRASACCAHGCGESVETACRCSPTSRWCPQCVTQDVACTDTGLPSCATVASARLPCHVRDSDRIEASNVCATTLLLDRSTHSKGRLAIGVIEFTTSPSINLDKLEIVHSSTRSSFDSRAELGYSASMGCSRHPLCCCRGLRVVA